MAEPGFWDAPERAQAVVESMKALRAVVEPWARFEKGLEDAAVLLELGAEADDAATLAEAEAELQKLRGDLEGLELRAMLAGPNDAGGAFVQISAGAGGTESCDWAQMLVRMYARWAERAGFAVEGARPHAQRRGGHPRRAARGARALRLRLPEDRVGRAPPGAHQRPSTRRSAARPPSPPWT